MATTYITAADLKTATTNTALAAESVATVESLIERAEKYIDSFCGYWDKYDTDQTRLFPRLQDVDTDGTTFIHDMIVESTIIQVEFLYSQTPDDEDGLKEDDSKKIPQTVSPRMKQLLRGAGMTRRGGKVLFSGTDFNPNKI